VTIGTAVEVAISFVVLIIAGGVVDEMEEECVVVEVSPGRAVESTELVEDEVLVSINEVVEVKIIIDELVSLVIPFVVVLEESVVGLAVVDVTDA
jgi:hypothetical protein